MLVLFFSALKILDLLYMKDLKLKMEEVNAVLQCHAWP